MYNPSQIEIDRLKKLETLLTGKLTEVTQAFETRMVSLDKHINRPLVDSVLAKAISLDYGDSELSRFYVTHPIRVATFAIDWMLLHKIYSTDFVVAALLHNVFEKGVMTVEDCKAQYGDWVSCTIKTLTPDREELKTIVGKNRYYQNIYSLDSMGQLLKLLDKFDNIYSLCLSDNAELRNDYLNEITTYIRPIAVNYYPEILTYFDELVAATKKIGHFKPKFNS